MRATKRPRGATPVRNSGKAALWSGLPRAHALLGAGLSLLLAVFFFTSGDDSISAVEPTIEEEPLAITASLPPEPAALPATPAEPMTPVVVERPWIEETVRSGDNLSLIFKRAGYSGRDVHEVVTGAEHGKSLERIFPGQTIAFQADAEGDLAAVRYTESPLQTITYERGAEGFSSSITTREPEVREAWATGQITSSLYLAGQEAGLSQNIIMELANIFGGVIDFVLDPREGDTIQLLYEEQYLDDEKFRDGEIIAASFTNRGTTFNAYRYEDANGDVGYFNEEGVSMRKAFLLAPVDFTRISSNFNLRRLHPIYKTTRPHRGTDYAAPRGTPVFAAGDGRVAAAGYTPANGNYVFIQHGEQYVTKYLHLNKRHVRKGQRVVQSQVIGTVGSTGAATGPHLHYEFLVNGVHRNPRTIHTKLPKAKSLPESEMARFAAAINRSATALAALHPDNRVAMTDSGEPPAN